MGCTNEKPSRRPLDDCVTAVKPSSDPVDHQHSHPKNDDASATDTGILVNQDNNGQ